jgi:hypothetical protein
MWRRDQQSRDDTLPVEQAFIDPRNSHSFILDSRERRPVRRRSAPNMSAIGTCPLHTTAAVDGTGKSKFVTVVSMIGPHICPYVLGKVSHTAPSVTSIPSCGQAHIG